MKIGDQRIGTRGLIVRVFNGLNKILEPLVSEAESDNERFSNIWVPGLSHYFHNLREIYRFLSSFSFAVSAFSKGGVLEVNPVDLIAIETLRIAEPMLYESIRKNKFALTKYSAREDRDGDLRSEVAETLLASVDEPGDAIRSILKELFPVLEGVWDNHSYSSEFVPSWVRARRICTERFFNRYFLLEVPKDQVSEQMIQDVLNASDDRSKLTPIFEELRVRGLALDALERLEAEERLTSLPDPFPYIASVSDICDFLPQRRVLFASLSPGLYAHSALNRALVRMQDEEAKKQLVIRLIEESTGLSVAASLIERLRERRPDTLLPQIPSDECDRLKEVWVHRVRAAAESGYLLRIQELFGVLWLWRQSTDAQEVTAWVVAILRNERHVFTLLRALTSKGSSFNLGGYHLRDESKIDPTILQDFCFFVEWEALEIRLESKTNLNTEDQRVVDRFKRGMQKWRTDLAVASSTSESPET